MDLLTAVTEKDLLVDNAEIVIAKKLTKSKYLDNIKDAAKDNDSKEVILRIGNNCGRTLEPRVVVPSKNGVLMRLHSS